MSSLGSSRQIRRRLRGVENTKKITRAMEMVAAVKLRRFQELLESARPYTEELEEMLNQLLKESLPPSLPPFLERETSDGKRALLLFTSDTGLCGTYNSDLVEKAEGWLEENPDRQTYFIFVGKRGGRRWTKNGAQVLATFPDRGRDQMEGLLEELRKIVENAFLKKKVEEVRVIYSRMESLTRYHPTVELLLPIQKKEPSEREPFPLLVEPDLGGVLEKLVPAFFEARLRFIFYHARLTEQIARMSAMRQATQNAEEMIDELTLLRNKARQAAITKEIIEVVSGSRALKLK